MRLLAAAGLLLGGCGQPTEQARNDTQSLPASHGWQLQADGEPALVLTGTTGGAEIRIICRPGRQLIVNVPRFEPIGSEERLSFGQGSEVVALVADVRGDRSRGGVSGEGALPADLAVLLSGRVSASYGAQTSGPHPAPPAPLVDAFAGACSSEADRSATGGTSETSVRTSASTSACLRTREGEPVPPNAIRAIGTEPFWAAQVEGRCVTYSHPENQSGTRVWTRFSGTARNGTWSGSLDGQVFEMRTRPQARCSDGMSDKVYPIAVSLTVGGEQRSGCAEPT